MKERIVDFIYDLWDTVTEYILNHPVDAVRDTLSLAFFGLAFCVMLQLVAVFTAWVWGLR